VLPKGPLSVGAVSYNAVLSGGIDDVHGLPWASSASACEPLEILSSISGFSYTVSDSTTSSGTYDCTLEAKEAGAVPGVDCQEATVKVSSAANPVYTDFLVTVTVANDTGGTIMEKVQGGLAASGKATYLDAAGNPLPIVSSSSNGVVYSVPDISSGCGAAVLNLSAAKTSEGKQQGNVVIWGDGTTATNQAGFSMVQGQVCTLQIMVRKGYSSVGQQPITSSWSETQTGPGTFYGKSPYTGRLSVNVVP
jgi:hypothetical protein